jgi:hypothetical protein
MPKTTDEAHPAVKGKCREETTMVAHPKTMQTVIDQRWHELRVEVERERRAMTTLEQTPAATPIATLRLHVGNPVRMLQASLGRHLANGMPRGAQRSLIP